MTTGTSLHPAWWAKARRGGGRFGACGEIFNLGYAISKVYVAEIDREASFSFRQRAQNRTHSHSQSSCVCHLCKFVFSCDALRGCTAIHAPVANNKLTVLLNLISRVGLALAGATSSAGRSHLASTTANGNGGAAVVVCEACVAATNRVYVCQVVPHDARGYEHARVADRVLDADPHCD